MVHLTAAEVEALCADEVHAGRVLTASAGGGGRRRGRRGERAGRPRLSRRERREVNDALLRRNFGGDDVKGLFDARARAPTAFYALRDVLAVRSAATPSPTTPTRTAPQRADWRIRALAKEKGSFVLPLIGDIEERVRGARAGERIMLHLADSLSRLIAHGVAQFYGRVHRSERVGSERVVVVCSPLNPSPLPAVKLVDMIS